MTITLHDELYAVFIISLPFRPRMKNISDKKTLA